MQLSHEILGDLAHGATAFYDWNLLLDERGGPNHVGNFCHAPYLFDTKAKELRPQLLLQYYYQFAHFIQPGSVRVMLSRYTDRCEAAAFRRRTVGSRSFCSTARKRRCPSTCACRAASPR